MSSADTSSEFLSIIFALSVAYRCYNHPVCKSNDRQAGGSCKYKAMQERDVPMTYDRMEAKPIPGEICRFCGDDSAPLVKTPCCDQWICCDTSYLSYRVGGRCQFEHENYSICHFHYNEKHHGRWQNCKECRRFFGEDEFKRLAEDRMNTPRY